MDVSIQQMLKAIRRDLRLLMLLDRTVLHQLSEHERQLSVFVHDIQLQADGNVNEQDDVIAVLHGIIGDILDCGLPNTMMEVLVNRVSSACSDVIIRCMHIRRSSSGSMPTVGPWPLTKKNGGYPHEEYPPYT
jgi:hypothetical protein